MDMFAAFDAQVAGIMTDHRAKMDEMRAEFDASLQHREDWYHWLMDSGTVKHQQHIESIRLIGAWDMPLSERLAFTRRQAMVHRPTEPQKRWIGQAPFIRQGCWHGCSHYDCDRCGLDVELWEAYEE